LRIGFHTSTGSAFTIEVDGRQYLVTAKHVIAGFDVGAKDSDPVCFFFKENWHTLEINRVWYPSDGSDVAVMSLRHIMGQTNEHGPDANFLRHQDCYIVGFPYAQRSSPAILERENGFPYPFARKGIIAGVMKESDKQHPTLYVDTYANPGFSGGPIVFERLDRPRGYHYRICGVLQGYMQTEEPVIGYEKKAVSTLSIFGNAHLSVGSSIQYAIDGAKALSDGALLGPNDYTSPT
jgi:hypothetical protein